MFRFVVSHRDACLNYQTDFAIVNLWNHTYLGQWSPVPDSQTSWLFWITSWSGMEIELHLGVNRICMEPLPVCRKASTLLTLVFCALPGTQAHCGWARGKDYRGLFTKKLTSAARVFYTPRLGHGSLRKDHAQLTLLASRWLR